MKANQLATLVLRLLGIYCLIQFGPTFLEFSGFFIAIQSIGHSDSHAMDTFSSIGAFVPSFIISICWLAVAILLFARSVHWGEKLAKGIGEENLTAISFEQAQVLAFAVVGALIFAGGLSQLFSDIYAALASLKYFNKEQYPLGMEFKDWRYLLVAFGALLKTALGLWMFFGARGFANLWRSLRNFGTPKPPEN